MTLQHMTSCMLVPHDSLYMNKLFAVLWLSKIKYRKLWREDLSVNSVKHTDLVREGGVLFASRWLVRDAILKDVSIDKSTSPWGSARNVNAMVVSNF